MPQILLEPASFYANLDGYLQENHIHHVLLVCGGSIRNLPIDAYFTQMEERIGVKVTRFTEFAPNPSWDSCEKGTSVYLKSHCDAVIACGGGSAIDVAKCIALWSVYGIGGSSRKAGPEPEATLLIAIPTTAGTGSEATRFAVVYRNGEKVSVDDAVCLPRAVILDPTLLLTLPPYQRRATMMDAFCHAIESFWSVNSTDLSRSHAKNAIHQIMTNIESYLANTPEGNRAMMQCAYRAGMAINLTKTTAGHAMCYKLTSKYHMAHGHAAAVCVAKLWPYMKERVITHPEECVDPRGASWLNEIFRQLEEELSTRDFEQILLRIGLSAPDVKVTPEEYDELAASVNTERLANNPMKLDAQTLEQLYYEILR